MGLTNLRHQGGTPPAPAPKAPEGPVEAKRAHLNLPRLRGWFTQFAALHHVTMAVVDSHGEAVAGPFNEPSFCQTMKATPGGECPGDCGHAASGGAPAWRCPYHLTCGSVSIQGPGGQPLRLVVGRTLASQEDLSACQDAAAVIPAMADDALAALATVPWRSAEQLTPLLTFLETSVGLMAETLPARSEKPKDLTQLRRNVSRG